MKHNSTLDFKLRIFKPVFMFQETEKVLVLNKTNATIIAGLYGNNLSDWIDKKIALFVTEVSFQGRQVKGVRVRSRIPKSDLPTFDF